MMLTSLPSPHPVPLRQAWRSTPTSAEGAGSARNSLGTGQQTATAPSARPAHITLPGEGAAAEYMPAEEVVRMAAGVVMLPDEGEMRAPAVAEADEDTVGDVGATRPRRLGSKLQRILASSAYSGVQQAWR